MNEPLRVFSDEGMISVGDEWDLDIVSGQDIDPQETTPDVAVYDGVGFRVDMSNSSVVDAGGWSRCVVLARFPRHKTDRVARLFVRFVEEKLRNHLGQQRVYQEALMFLKLGSQVNWTDHDLRDVRPEEFVDLSFARFRAWRRIRALGV